LLIRIRIDRVHELAMTMMTAVLGRLSPAGSLETGLLGQSRLFQALVSQGIAQRRACESSACLGEMMTMMVVAVLSLSMRLRDHPKRLLRLLAMKLLRAEQKPAEPGG
jgi:hypothetical protein